MSGFEHLMLDDSLIHGVANVVVWLACFLVGIMAGSMAVGGRR